MYFLYCFSGFFLNDFGFHVFLLLSFNHLMSLIAFCFSKAINFQLNAALVLSHNFDILYFHFYWIQIPTISSSVTPFSSCLQSFPASGSFFSNGSVLLIRWLKYWSFSFSISPPNKYPGLISFRIDWFDFLAYQGTLNSLLQHHSSKAYGH